MIDTSKVKGYLLEYPDKESFSLSDKVTINFKSDVAEEGFYSEEDFDSREEFEDMVKSLYVDSNSVFNGSKITFLVDYKELGKWKIRFWLL